MLIGKNEVWGRVRSTPQVVVWKMMKQNEGVVREMQEELRIHVTDPRMREK